ncbi:MAG: glycosyltransferase family 2 protein [Caldilineaceae bacterium]|nr:glycosyltransferase family 2 protein [Caldilineaceae bacterium]
MQSPRHVVWPEWIESSGSPSTLPASGLPSGSVPSAEEIDLAIVIVNYSASALLSGCLASVFASAGDFSYTVCVVDNGSSDDSVAMMRDRFPQAGLILSETNLGFSAGNNLALRQLGLSERRPVPNRPLPRYTLLLNNDTVLPANVLADMIQFMDGRPDLGVAGPRVRRPDGTLDLACRRSFPTPWVSFCRMTRLSRLFPRSKRFNAYNLSYLPEDAVHPVDSVVGAYMQVRTQAILEVGLLDEAYFMYGEDLDWAKRIKSAGWEVWYNGEVEITHVKEASSRRSRKARRAFYEAMWIFYRKHYRANSSWMLDKLIWLSISLIGGVDIAIRLWKLRQKRI